MYLISDTIPVREEQQEDFQQYNLVQKFGFSPLRILACNAM